MPMKKIFFLLTTCASLFSACVGTDELDDSDQILIEGVKETYSLTIDPTQKGLMVDESSQFVAELIKTTGTEVEVIPATYTWTSDDPAVASVNENGLVKANSVGMTFIRASTDTLQAETVVTVVNDTLSVAEVKIDQANTMTLLAPGESLNLTASAYNVKQKALTGKTITWTSNNESVITVNSTGTINAVSEGIASIVATIDGVVSASLKIEVKSNIKKGVFSGSGSYTVTGTASLFINENDDLILEFSNDFSVSSFGVAIYVYMSNQNNSVAGGVEIQQLLKQGGQSYNITNINSELTIDSYDYVIIHCKPYNIPFGQSSKLE